MEKIYLSGKITNGKDKISEKELKKVQQKFKIKEDELRAEGFWVKNPFNIAKGKSTWKSAMQVCINKLFDCDSIYLFADWKESKGARIEAEIANSLGLKVYYEKVSVESENINCNLNIGSKSEKYFPIVELAFNLFEVESPKRKSFQKSQAFAAISNYLYFEKGITTVDIAELLNKDHSTIIYHKKKFEDLSYFHQFRQKYNKFKELVCQIY